MLRNVRGAPALLLGSSLLACSGGARQEPATIAATKAAPPAATSPAERTSPSAVPAGADGQVRRIEAEVARIDSMRKPGRGRLELYARVGGTDQLVPVKDTLSWPEGLDESFNLLRDGSGRVRLLYESPLSESGDWDNEYTHYFDEQGRLIEFERYSGFFNGCPGGLAMETTRRFYSPTGQLLKQTYELKSGKGAPIDSTPCQFPYRMPYEIYPTWGAAAKALGLGGAR